MCVFTALLHNGSNFYRKKRRWIIKAWKTEIVASLLWLQLISFQSELEPHLHSLCFIFYSYIFYTYRFIFYPYTGIPNSSKTPPSTGLLIHIEIYLIKNPSTSGFNEPAACTTVWKPLTYILCPQATWLRTLPRHLNLVCQRKRFGQHKEYS